MIHTLEHVGVMRHADAPPVMIVVVLPGMFPPKMYAL